MPSGTNGLSLKRRPRGRRFRPRSAIRTRRSRSWWSRRSELTLARRPAVGLGAGAAHQHGPLGVAEALGLEERLDGLLVVDDGEGARPVGAPQAAVETPGVEHALERVPDVGERIRLLGQGAGAADLDHRVLALGEVQHLREVGPGLWR